MRSDPGAPSEFSDQLNPESMPSDKGRHLVVCVGLMGADVLKIFGSFLGCVTKLIDILKFRKLARQDVFSKIIDPLYGESEPVAADVFEFFRTVREGLRTDQGKAGYGRFHTLGQMKDTLRTMRERFLMARIRVKELAAALATNPSIDEPAREFASALSLFFASGTDLVRTAHRHASQPGWADPGEKAASDEASVPYTMAEIARWVAYHEEFPEAEQQRPPPTLYGLEDTVQSILTALERNWRLVSATYASAQAHFLVSSG
jgi:hypothetical protein